GLLVLKEALQKTYRFLFGGCLGKIMIDAVLPEGLSVDLCRLHGEYHHPQLGVYFADIRQYLQRAPIRQDNIQYQMAVSFPGQFLHQLITAHYLTDIRKTKMQLQE